MENRYVFREVLSEIKDAADAAGNVITKEEIRERLKELPLTEEHFQMITSTWRSRACVCRMMQRRQKSFQRNRRS